MSNLNIDVPDQNDPNETVLQDKPRAGWVKFDDENPTAQSVNPIEESKFTTSITSDSSASTSSNPPPAILKTESVHINLDRIDRVSDQISQASTATVDLVNVRHGFSNGDIIVTVLPVNSNLPWLTPARFRPELVPEELMAQGFTLTVEEYVHAMELLVNDGRFTMYNICYKRVLICWITLAFVVLLALLFSGLTGLVLFTLGVVWLILNAVAIFLCMWVKMKLSRGLEQCLASVNKLLTKHKLVITLDDRGKISCHKVNLCFLYFDSGPCIAHIQQFIDSEEGRSIVEGWEQRLDITASDIIIQGAQSTRLSRKQERAALLYLRYVGRWGARAIKNKLNLDTMVPGRHGEKYLCPCQFIEEHLQTKPPAGLDKYFQTTYEMFQWTI